MTIRTLSIVLANASGLCANLAGLKVSFYDEALPHLTTTPKYQSGSQKTNALGVMTFAVDTTLPSGQSGLLTVIGSAGVHYNGACRVI